MARPQYGPAGSGTGPFVDKGGQVYNVKAFGAKADGTTDDTAAIQSAITAAGAAGGIIQFPPGTCLVSQQGSLATDALTTPYALNIPASVGPIILQGSGHGSAIKLANSQPTSTVLVLVSGSYAAQRASATTIQDLEIHGNSLNNRPWTGMDFGMVTVLYAHRTTIQRCYLHDWADFGMHGLRTSQHLVIRDNDFVATNMDLTQAHTALRVETSGAMVVNNRFVSDPFTGQGAISVSDNADIYAQTHGVMIVGNEFYGGNNSYIVALNGVTHCVVANNLFRDMCGSSGICLGIGSYFNANGTYYDATHNIVTGNTFHNVRNAIQLSGSTGTINSTSWAGGAYRNLVDRNIIGKFVDYTKTAIGASGAIGFPFSHPAAPRQTFLSGTATAGTSTSLTDGTQTLLNNMLVSLVVHITGGTGVGQSRRISSNTTGGQIIVGIAWTTTPDTTSTYEVIDRGYGTATSGTSTTLVDSTAVWGTGVWNSSKIRIIGGTGVGQVRNINSTAATSVTVDVAWITTPDATSQYAIENYVVNLVKGIEETNPANNTGTATAATSTTLTDSGATFPTTNGGRKNYTVWITGGTGAGQYRTISSNTSTQLTVATAWTTTPDTTSTYAVASPAGDNVIEGNVIDPSNASSVGVSLTTPSVTTRVNGNVFVASPTAMTNALVSNGAATPTIRGNIGHNPKGNVTAPSVPASGTALPNTTGYDCMVNVSGGTVTAIAVGGTAITGLTSGWVRVPALQTVTLTYSVAPAWQWFGD